MTISEQVNELRKAAKTSEKFDYGKMLNRAAHTIEFLKAKLYELSEVNRELETAFIERSITFHYNLWVLCSDRLPKDCVLFKTTNGNIYKGLYSYDSETWTDCRGSKLETWTRRSKFDADDVIAWKMMPQANNTISMDDLFELVGDNTIIKIYCQDRIITQGNWYQDNILEYQDEKDVDFIFYKDDNLCLVFLK